MERSKELLHSIRENAFHQSDIEVEISPLQRLPPHRRHVITRLLSWKSHGSAHFASIIHETNGKKTRTRCVGSESAELTPKIQPQCRLGDPPQPTDLREPWKGQYSLPAVRGTVIPIAVMEISMKDPGRRRFKLAGGLLVLTVFLGGCGGTMTFQGSNAFAVGGHQAAVPAPAPAPAPAHVAVRDNKIEIDEKIQFEHDKATILPVSFALMDEVAKVMKENPQLKKVLVEGHASSEGDAAHNLKLSDDRAKSVMNYLVEHGVEKARLSAKGFGTTQPVADNATEQGREKNRRVEFTILDPGAKGAAK